MSYLHFLRDNARWLLAGFLLSLASSFGQTYFISIFAGQMMVDLGLSDGEWGLIYTLGTTASAAIMVWAGVLTDHFRVRVLGPSALVALALSCVAMSLVATPWMLVLVILALRLNGQGMLSHIAVVALARWFVANRGRALAVGSLGFAVGQAGLPVIFVRLLDSYDWRSLWLLSGLLALAVIPVLLGLLTRERTPQSVAAESPVTGIGGRHWTRAQALRHPLFWLMVPVLLGPSAWGTALFFQQVHYAEVKGWGHPAFVALFPLFTAASVATTFLSGWAIDRFGATRMMIGYMLPFAISFTILAYADSIGAAAFGMALVGFSVGVSATLPSAFWAEVYGTRHLGAIKSLVTAVMVLGSALGPGITGLLIDQGINFPQQLIGIAVYFLFAAGCATLAIRSIH